MLTVADLSVFSEGRKDEKVRGLSLSFKPVADLKLIRSDSVENRCVNSSVHA